jgi:hypothetical protein
MEIIDADAHVVESDRTWDFLNEADKQFAPRVMVFKDRDGASASQRSVLEDRRPGFRQRTKHRP